MTDFLNEYDKLIEKIRSVPDYELICEQVNIVEKFEKNECTDIKIEYSTKGSI